MKKRLISAFYELSKYKKNYLYKGGSEFAINSRAVMAVINCNLAAGVGGLTWMFVEMIKHKKKKMSLNGFCSGAISGLCVITPSAGYIRPHFAVVCGFIGYKPTKFL